MAGVGFWIQDVRGEAVALGAVRGLVVTKVFPYLAWTYRVLFVALTILFEVVRLPVRATITSSLSGI
jgi:hypothetical protein